MTQSLAPVLPMTPQAATDPASQFALDLVSQNRAVAARIARALAAILEAAPTAEQAAFLQELASP